MNGSHAPLRGAGRAACALALAAVALTGCSWFRHGNAAKSCREPQVTTNIDSLPPLRVPPGLDPADTHNGVHIPELAGPERVRSRNEPCLSLPPSYGNPVATPGMLPPTSLPATPPARTDQPGGDGSGGAGSGGAGRAPPN